MTNFLKVLFSFTVILFCASCDNVFENVQAGSFTELQKSNAAEQDNFEIQLKTLTMAEANKSKSEKYPRNVMVPGIGASANVYTEVSLLNGPLPPRTQIEEYMLGTGDQLTFVQIEDGENANSTLNLAVSENKNISTDNDTRLLSSGKVGSDGSVLLLGVGKLNAKGRTINELRAEVRNILVRKGLVPNFQLEITDFKSRQAYLFGANVKNGVVQITQRPLTLKELAASGGYTPQPNFINLVTLKRDAKTYILNSNQLFDENRSEIIIQDKDQIELTSYPYKPGQVYFLSADRSANIIPLNPAKRETMADIMFLPNGPLSNPNAKRSEIYLLRGKDPVTAFHLDAQNASRILVAAEMELRPSDILFVATRPIISFNRLLGEITPLRILLRDLKNENIP
jgi:polysaccharide biosynthesis/export protein